MLGTSWIINPPEDVEESEREIPLKSSLPITTMSRV